MVLRGHDGMIWSVVFGPDGRYLASGGKDTSIRVWNLADPGTPPVLLYGENGEVWSLAFSPDGKTLAAGGGDKGVLLWDLTHPVNTAPLEDIADLVCQEVWRNLTLDEWREFVSEDLPYQRTCPGLPADPSMPDDE